MWSPKPLQYAPGFNVDTIGKVVRRELALSAQVDLGINIVAENQVDGTWENITPKLSTDALGSRYHVFYLPFSSKKMSFV
jgi:hypothetical protein